MIQFDKDWLAFMRDLFPKGTQIRCSNTKGGVPALSGEMGTVEYIGDSGIFHCTLEDGRTLVAAIDEDCFRVDLQEQAEPSGKELHQALKDRNQNLPECSESHCLQRIAILGVVDSERLPEWAADILFPPLRSILVLPGEAVRAIEVSSLRRSICRQLDAKRLDCAGSCSERESINLYFDSDAQKKGLPFNRCLDGQNYYGPVLINGMHEEARSLTDLEMIGLLQRLNAPEAMREAHKWDTSDRKRGGEATMSGIVELKLYSPLQVDIIDRDRSGPPIPLQAVNREQGGEYLGKIMNAFRELQFQEDARNAFIASEQDWSEICEKIISLTHTVEAFNGTLYGVYTCRSSGVLDPGETDDLKWYCHDQWENGWGEGYACCPCEGGGLGLYIHFWQDDSAPLLTRDKLEAARSMEKEQCLPLVTEVTPDTFWTMLAQAKTACDGNQRAAAYWLTERLLAMGPEQALNFHSIMHGYMDLADKYGLWNAATLIHEDGCYSDGFEDFRAWLIFQGKETYLAALKDPDSLADVPACVKDDCRFADLPYVGSTAYARLTDRMAHDDIAPADQRKMEIELQKSIVYGPGIEYPYEWSEVAVYLPRLTAQHLTPEELRACVHRGHLWDHSDPEIQRLRAEMPKKKRTRSRKKKEGDAR